MTSSTPVVTFVVPTSAERSDLDRLAASLGRQSDDRWELVLYGEAASARARTLFSVDAADRVEVVEVMGSPTEMLRAAVMAASGQVVCLLQACTVGTDAVALVAEALIEHPDVDVLYGDDAVVDEAGALVEVLGRPVWSPVRLRGHHYLDQAALVRRELLQAVLGLPDQPAQAAAGHDLFLAVTEQAREVVHIPAVLSAGLAGDRVVDDATWDESVRAVQGQLDRLQLAGAAVRGTAPRTVAVLADGELPASVSVIVATNGATGLVRGERRRLVVEAARSLLGLGDDPRLEIVVVHGLGCPGAVLAELRDVVGERLTLVPFGKPFALEEMLNRGIASSNAEVVVLLDEASEAATPDFVAQLVAPLSYPGVGLTGPLIKATNQNLVGTGVAVFAHRVAAMYRDVFETQAAEALAVTREVSALDATCVAIPRGTLESVGGVAESLPGLWSLDLSSKVSALDLSRVWVATAQLYDLKVVDEPAWALPSERRPLFLRWGAGDVDPFEPGYGRRLLERRREERARWQG